MAKTKDKKMDLRPIFIYLGSMFILAAIVLIICGILQVHEDIANAVTQFVAEIVPAVIFFLLYKKVLKKDVKRFTLRKLLIVLIVAVCGSIVNEILTPYVVTDNQNLLIQMIHSVPILSIVTIAIIGPFVEEMVFRYSFDTFIKNETVFLIVSSLAFGLIHTGGFGAGWWLYVLLGVLMGAVYIKTDHNVVASTLVHIILNIVDILFIIL